MSNVGCCFEPGLDQIKVNNNNPKYFFLSLNIFGTKKSKITHPNKQTTYPKPIEVLVKIFERKILEDFGIDYEKF